MSDAPAYRLETDAQGATVVTWADQTVITVHGHQPDARGRYLTEVTSHGHLIGRGIVNLDDLADRERLHVHCQHLDGDTNWIARLMLVAQILSTLPPTAPPAVPEPPWPTLDAAAYHGLAGQIVRTIAPHTEGDPVAVLVQLLVMVGCAIGRVPYYVVEADRHYPNCFVCLVGKTSRGRKGTSVGYPQRLLSASDPGFATRLMGGLSSGEGVIWQVRDAVHSLSKDGEEVLKDAGVDDKRLCILETEFARGLAKMNQDGSVLSAILRQAYDHGTLRSLVSGRTHPPVTATGAHIAVIAHITLDELQRLLTETEAANGLGNRFLWICTQRAQLLPDGGGYPDEALAPYTVQLQHVLATARRRGRLQRSAAAQTWWRRTYPTLTAERAGLLGALTARAEAHVLRLSCLYALLDAEETITPEHLDAAYAVWLYAEQSARYLFGELLGDPLADEILRMIRATGRQGMTRTEISHACGRNVPSARLSTVLERLQREQLLTCQRQPTTGRPVERLYADRRVTN